MQTSFENCTYLTQVDFSQTDMSYCTSIAWAFKNTGFSSLTLNFDTSSLTNMQSAFNYMTNLTYIDLSGINTSYVTTMRTMLQNDGELLNANLSYLDMSSVTDCNYMFQNCNKLETLTLNNVDNSTFAKIVDYNTTKLSTTVTIYRDGDTYNYNSTQDTWVKNT